MTDIINQRLRYNDLFFIYSYTTLINYKFFIGYDECHVNTIF